MIKAYCAKGKEFEKESEVLIEFPSSLYLKKKNGIVLIGLSAKEALFLLSDLRDATVAAIKDLKGDK
jgi:hypothetical protein